MDYEKKYKEALANARQEYNTTENVERKQWLEELFPELKESEDERIRKEILSLVQYTKGRLIGYKPRIHQDKMITWLEKQGDSPIKWNKNTKGNKPQKKHSVLIKTTHGIAEGEWNGGEHWIQYRWSGSIKDSDVLFWIELSDIEKQSEQKPFDYENANIQQKDFAPKVEPKFKVGDTMRTLQEAADGYTGGMPVVVSVDKEYYHCTNELIAIKDQDDYEYPPRNRRQKPTDKEEPKRVSRG